MSDPDKTRIVRRPINITAPEQSIAPGATPSEDMPTRVLRREDSGDDVTRKIGSSDDDKTNVARPDDGKTVLIRPSKSGSDKSSFHPLAPAGSSASSVSGEEGEPVVGWLVVLKGPGRGKAVPLGYGWNTIGRDASQRARLDFGDSQISRLNHAKLLYDPKSRKFTLTLGDNPNPTYIKEEAVLGPTKLENGDKIQLGETTILFHALCGPDFDWQDSE